MCVCEGVPFAVATLANIFVCVCVCVCVRVGVFYIIFTAISFLVGINRLVWFNCDKMRSLSEGLALYMVIG